MTRTWLITGCSTGFGRVLAELLLERGERVVATARDPATVKDLIDAYPDSALALALDVTRPEQIAAAVSAAQRRFGTIDTLVNNAGRGAMAVVEDIAIAEARALMEVNYFGALGMIQAVLPGMREARSGRIVNIGSVAGQLGFPAIGHYSASKFALAGLTESLGAELEALGITVMLAELGPFATQFTASMTMTMPASSDYDLAAMSAKAGNSHWGAGDDARAGAAALIAALDDPAPPRRLVLGGHGIDVIDLHAGRRNETLERWRRISTLEPFLAVSSAT